MGLEEVRVVERNAVFVVGSWAGFRELFIAVVGEFYYGRGDGLVFKSLLYFLIFRRFSVLGFFCLFR